MREQRLVFGEVARDYDDVRAGYSAEIAERIFGYAGGLRPVVEIGAGTGKATELFVSAGAAVTCVEPDPAMAEVLDDRFGDRVRIEVRRFEDWSPPAGGVPLLCSAQAFHWVDPATRWSLAHAALAPGGTLALFGHAYAFADIGLDAALQEVYAKLAPELLDGNPPGYRLAAEENWFHVEMAGSGRFADVTSVLMQSVVGYPAERYRALLTTFSNHRMLPEQRRTALHDGIDEVVRRYGGVVDVALDTLLTLGRRVSPEFVPPSC